jgi:hypothetical protein
MSRMRNRRPGIGDDHMSAGRVRGGGGRDLEAYGKFDNFPLPPRSPIPKLPAACGIFGRDAAERRRWAAEHRGP